jgi:glycosyltransferase involved in cell wall biosynthesis
MKGINNTPHILGMLNEQPDHRLIGCTWYRCIIPLKAIEQAGLGTHEFMTIDKFNQLRVDRQLAGTLVNYDMVLFQRIIEAREKEGRMNWLHGAITLRALGIAPIADYDDDFTGEHRDLGADLPDLSAFSLITVSTKYVKDQMLKRQPGLNIAVLPNMVVPSMFSGMARTIPPLVIGLTGSQSHRQDWDAVVPALLRVKRMVPGVKILAAGYVPDSLKDIPGLLTMRDLAGADVNDNTFVQFHQYGGTVMRNIDILLCPVDPSDPFSHGRSAIKALEGMAAGAVPIVTGDVPCYAGTVVDGANGYMVRHQDVDAWYRRMMGLISDPIMRMRMQREGRKTASQNAASHLTASRYAAAYTAAITEAQQPENVAAARAKLFEIAEEKQNEQLEPARP